MNNIEIERKYLVKDDSFKQMAVQVKHLSQGYLSTDKDTTIRVRIADNRAFLTIKGSNQQGSIEHFEWEKEIELTDAQQLMKLCQNKIIEKDRYIVPFGELKIEVDVFHDQNQGLLLAEIELPSEDYPLPHLPTFIGQEVTTNPQFYNSYLVTHPFNS